ncbi:MAG: alpha/beta fold hydrolase [Oligoflexales bacterium]|nr:alpha/beta fold hydrolase [Oligoflexales bacterium]
MRTLPVIIFFCTSFQIITLACKHTDEKEGLSKVSSSEDLWPQPFREYVGSLPVDRIQENCRPRIIFPNGERKGVVFMIHGFTACPQQYFEIGERLAGEGYEVVLPLMPGHGRLPIMKNGKETDDLSGLADDKNYMKVYGDFSDLINKIAESYPAPRIVAGLSVGASAAMLASQRRPDIWDKALIMTPAFEIANNYVWLLVGTLHIADEMPINLIPRSVYNERKSWGPGCMVERSMPNARAGICEFLTKNVVGMNQFGYDVWHMLKPNALKVQFVGVENDPVANPKAIFNAVGRLRGEKMGVIPYYSKKRMDEHESVRICIMPKDVNHSLLSRYDSPGENKYWIPGLVRQLEAFITEGVFIPFDKGNRHHNDPACIFQ